MSDDSHRPTYTPTSSDINGAFNASQVRLYGIAGPYFKAKGKESKGDKKGPHVMTGVSDNGSALALVYQGEKKSNADQQRDQRDREANNEDQRKTALKELINNALPDLSKIVDDTFRFADSSFVFVKSVIGRHMILVSSIDMTPGKEDNKVLTSGIIFGYAYEGHCYELPKPKVMLIPALPDDIPDDDCGYKKKESANYKVWIVDKLEQCIEFEVSQGFVEQLVLEANLPGKRSPSMYAGRMMLAHRTGRLSE